MRNLILDTSLAGLLFALATSAIASDGVLEINQACAVNTGCFSGDSLGFPVTLDGSAGRSYRLTSDLQLPDQNTTAISIEASNLTVDLGGFKIQGVTTCTGSPLVCTPTGTGRGVSEPGLGVPTTSIHEGIRVQNGTVTGMGNIGVFVGNRGVAENVRASHNGTAAIAGGVGSTLRNNVASSNGEFGLLGNTGSSITGNVASLNGTFGIRGTDSLIRGNTAFSNETDGLQSLSSSTIIDNSSYGNGRRGIFADSGTTVRGNTVRSNSSDGVILNSDAAYQENVVTNNGLFAVLGGENRGDNYCAGSNTPPPFCP